MKEGKTEKFKIEIHNVPVTGKTEDGELILDFANKTFHSVDHVFEIEPTESDITLASNKVAEYNRDQRVLAKKIITSFPSTIKMKFINI